MEMAFAGGGLDRAAHLRAAEGWRGDARVLPVWRGRVCMQGDALVRLEPGHPALSGGAPAVLLGLVISAFEGTVVTTAMPTITRALGGQALYAWVFTAFLLASTIGVMVVGKLGDQLGRKPAFLGGLALFLAGSALCGAATSVPWLIAFRVLQGLGAGAVQPTTMTIGADLYTLKERAAVQSVFTGVWGVANVLGPVMEFLPAVPHSPARGAL